MKNKNYLSMFMIPGLLISSCCLLVGCVNPYKITRKTVPFVNKSSTSYQISSKEIDIYYVNSSDVPYIDVLSFLRQLNGFFDNNNVYYSTNYDSLTIFYKRDYPITFNWYNNRISTANYYYSQMYVKKDGAVDYGSFYKGTKSLGSGGKTFSVDLDDYGFDIVEKDGKCLIPLFFANTLLCSPSYYNIIFNGEVSYGINRECGPISEYYNCSKNGENISSSLRKATLNSLYFIFDYLYGLKDDKNYSSFKKYLPNDISNLLLSTESSVNYSGYKKLIYGFLDELHTRIDFPSYFADPAINGFSYSDCGTFYTKYYTSKTSQTTLRENTIGGLVPIRYFNNIAIITFDSFKTGTYEQLYDSNKNLKEDAWKYDTYYFMRRCMDGIQTHSEVKEILIDLSLNGGGNVGALLRTLGFITDKDIPYSTYDYITDYYSIYNYQVDTDGDGEYSNDSYSQYRWNLLTSINTFSAANAMTSIFKEMNLGTVFGQKSGGGMCSVLPLVLADGTGIAISSTNTIRTVKEENGKRIFYAIEHGIVPDVEVEYSDFYNDAKLVEYLNNY